MSRCLSSIPVWPLITSLQTLRRGRRSEVSCADGSPSPSETTTDGPPPLRTVLTRPVVLSVANYGALALADIAFIAFLPLFLSTPIALGGLGLAPAAIGAILGSLGVLDGLFQALFFAPAIDRWGAKRVYQVGVAAFVPLYALFPTMNAVARAHGGVTYTVWAIVFLQLAMVCIMDMAFGEWRAGSPVLRGTMLTECRYRCGLHVRDVLGAEQPLSGRSERRRAVPRVRHARNRPCRVDIALRIVFGV